MARPSVKLNTIEEKISKMTSPTTQNSIFFIVTRRLKRTGALDLATEEHFSRGPRRINLVSTITIVIRKAKDTKRRNDIVLYRWPSTVRWPWCSRFVLWKYVEMPSAEYRNFQMTKPMMSTALQ
jgi:hypothetical protein